MIQAYCFRFYFLLVTVIIFGGMLFLVHSVRTFATVTTPVLGVLVNTLQYLNTVDFVQNSETEDPQLVAEPARGSKPWLRNGKE